MPHYVGSVVSINRQARVSDLKESDDKHRLSVGWGIQLIDKHKVAEVGDFNEGYIMGYGDDGEFNHKMNLIGHFCYNIPLVIVYHKRVRGAKRYLGGIGNRWRFLLEFYQLKSLILWSPAFVVYEIFSIFSYLKMVRLWITLGPWDICSPTSARF